MTYNDEFLKELIAKVTNDVRTHFENDTSGHDFEHLQRVVNNAKFICEKENVSVRDTDFIVLCAWLHDLGDYKLNKEGIDKSKGMITNLLQTYNTNIELINKVIEVVSEVSFSKGRAATSILSKIVQDADRLDAIGAIGIARCFAYGGSKNRPLYSDFPSKRAESSYQHFFDKLLLLKDRMNTQAAIEMAAERHAFMLDFMKRFETEMNPT